jgi:hypothetical protein
VRTPEHRCGREVQPTPDSVSATILNFSAQAWQAWAEKLRRLPFQTRFAEPRSTCISSSKIISTEQWLRATRSTLTPKAPAHLLSPAIAASPMESLPNGGTERLLAAAL